MTESDISPIESAFLQGDLSASAKLEQARTELLDLTARNRLLNIPRNSKSSRTIDIVDEISEEIFRILVSESRALTFLPGRAAGATHLDGVDIDIERDELDELAQPNDSVNEQGIFNRHLDTKLQTKLTSKGLQKRLLDLYSDARTLEEEQGVNILFLGLGTLKWVDPTNIKNIRYAPLILIPVSLERGNAAEQFKLKWRQEDPASNLSLEAFLERVHSLTLPTFDSGDDFSPNTYMNGVALAVGSKKDWSVAPNDMVLGFFSFAKFLMYRDLDPAVWPNEGGLTAQPLIRGLLSDGFAHNEALIPEDAAIDEHISPAELLHIVDCDSSQSLAVHDVRKGQNLVIQGPPGTGKSQTIANVIASAIADGKTVLFVAEKMAALEVVKRRLDQAGVGDACLELHSNKAKKRMLLDELRRTSELGSPKGEFASTLNSKLQHARDLLNDHAVRMHVPHSSAGLTPYQVIGQLSRLRQEACAPVDIRLEGPESWSADEREIRASLVAELAQRIAEIGLPSKHPWRGVGLTSIIPTDVERLIHKIDGLKSRATKIGDEQTALTRSLGLSEPSNLGDFTFSVELADRLATAPTLSGKAITASVWITHEREISTLLETGSRLSALSDSLHGKVTPAAWTADVDGMCTIISSLPPNFSTEGFKHIEVLHMLLPKFVVEVSRLAKYLEAADPIETITAVGRAIAIANRVATAPNVSPDVLVANVWEHGIEQAGDLAAAVAIFEQMKNSLRDKVVDSAWNVELGTTRQTLAVHGASLFRFFSGDWRKASALVKSFLKDPNIPISSQIEILDALVIGNKALSAIRENEQLGRAAFGEDWRSERSTAAPLQALVEWMRSLRGFGAEPRLIASRLPDRPAIGERATLLQRMLDELMPSLRSFWSDCDLTTGQIFPDAVGVEYASLSALINRIAALTKFYSEYSAIIANVPAQISASLELMTQLISAQQATNEINQATELGNAAFENQWRGVDSDWNMLAGAAQWIDSNPDVCALAAAHEDRASPALKANSISHEMIAFLGDTGNIFHDLCTDHQRLFGLSSLTALSASQLIERFTLWIDQAEQLSKWVAYRDRVEKAKVLGVGQLVSQMESGELPSAEATRTFDMAYYEALFADLARQDPKLARFDGHLHAQAVSDFVSLDRQRIAASSLEVAHAHHRRIPPQTGGGVGPLGVLRGEMARRRGHMPIRQLMLKAAPAVQALKPVLMMSPLSVAQFLPPGQLTFDLLVMDEASQIQPVDALGAIGRCRQVVVVGDERQLPPTRFFSKVTSGQDEDSEGDGAQVSDIESILGLFRARGLPQRMLRWHYRSRHQSLIAVSNSQFYENKLFIVPSPYTQEAGMGLQFHLVPNGVFDSGASGSNVVEAKAVAEAIIRHAKSSPDHSLGVATFSVAQRKAIQDQLELLRRVNPETEPFFYAHQNEPFFIKNLENVQGDERDVILISVGYGRNQQGYMAMRFGPLSADGGERRLNVLISRAKRRCEVYASITDEDIDLERGKGVGVFAFKLFLHFARTGKLGISQATERGYDSVFEVQVAASLQALGYQVHPQVGIAGFFIDLAIADPEMPGRYILGIECDGASYHNARSARDRDRLRQAVLEDHGWIIHRIWSTDWFQRPKEQLQRVVAAIEAAKNELDARRETRVVQSRAVPISVITIERSDTIEIGLERANEENQRVVAYVEAVPTRPSSALELHDTPVEVLADLVRKIVAIEGPVHVDEIVVRLRNAWNLKRAGARIQSSVERGIAAALRSNALIKNDCFLLMPDTPIVIRDRSTVQSDALRKPEMLPPQEIDAAIIDTIKRNFGGSSDEITQSVSRLFGFKATSGQLRETIQARIAALTQSDVLMQQENGLVLKNVDLTDA